MKIEIITITLNDNSCCYKIYEDDYMKKNKINDKIYFEIEEVEEILNDTQKEKFYDGERMFEITSPGIIKKYFDEVL